MNLEYMRMNPLNFPTCQSCAPSSKMKHLFKVQTFVKKKPKLLYQFSDIHWDANYPRDTLTVDDLKVVIDNPEVNIRYIEDESGRVMAFVIFTDDNEVIQIMSLSVRTENLRLGLGSALLADITETMKDTHSGICAFLDEQQLQLGAFFTANGFSYTCKVEKEDAPTAYLFELKNEKYVGNVKTK